MKSGFRALTSELQGNLKDTQLDNLLTLLGTTRKTGVLRLFFEDTLRNTSFAIRRGKIGRVKTHFAPKLTDIMVDRGASKEHIEALRRSQRESNRRVGETLVSQDSGVDYGVVIQALQRRLEMALIPLLLYPNQDGHFTFKAEAGGDALDAIFLEPGIEAQRLTLDVLRKLDELQHSYPDAATLRPHDHFVLQDTNVGLELHMQSFQHDEWLVVSHLFQPQSLHSLMLETRLVWDELLRCMLRLHERKLVVPYPPKNP